jgi:hypothetical protein
MDAINIAILLGLLLIALAITIIKLELVFRSVLHAYKEEKQIKQIKIDREEKKFESDLPLH